MKEIVVYWCIYKSKIDIKMCTPIFQLNIIKNFSVSY